jgi:hypothetical protein
LAAAELGAEAGTLIEPGLGTLIGGAMGTYLGLDIGHLVFAKPPKDATDPNGAKAPGKPGDTEGYCPGKKGDRWVNASQLRHAKRRS